MTNKRALQIVLSGIGMIPALFFTAVAVAVALFYLGLSWGIHANNSMKAGFNSNQVLADIKAQTGITLSTNTLILEAGADSRDPDHHQWKLFLKSPERIQIPDTQTSGIRIEDFLPDKTTIRLVKASAGIRIAKPTAFAFNNWEMLAGACNAGLVQYAEGDYLHLEIYKTRPQKDDYFHEAESGLKILPWPKQMEALLGDGDHEISDFGYHSAPRVWTTEIFFYGRYSLSVEMNVEIDSENSRVITNTSPPEFYLREVESVAKDSNGFRRAKIAYLWTFGDEKWNRLLQAKGDWSAIGIPVKTNNPIEGFDEYVKGERGPRIKIPQK